MAADTKTTTATMIKTNLSRTTFWQLPTKGKPKRNWMREMGYKLVDGKPVRLEKQCTQQAQSSRKH